MLGGGRNYLASSFDFHRDVCHKRGRLAAAVGSFKGGEDIIIGVVCNKIKVLQLN